MKWVRRAFTLYLLFMVAMPLLSFFTVPPAQAVFGAEDIYFEYGAESGALQPPWDEVKGGGSYGTVEVSTTYARTGTKSIYFYQEPPPKTDYSRRASVKVFGATHQKTEGYWSYWVYVDSQFLEDNLDWGPNMGGIQIRFGPENERHYRWWYGNQWHVTKTSKRIYMSLGWGKLSDGLEFSATADATEDTWYLDDVVGYESYTMDDFVGEWVHFQQYFKIASGTSGIMRAWFSAPDSGITTPVLVAEKTGFASDPRHYSEWNDNLYDGGSCEFLSKNNGPYPNLAVRLYQGEDSFENWMWVDDIVGSVEMVTEAYGVGAISSEFESWEDGFESGDFIEWNSTDYSGGGVAPSVTSTYSYAGTYSANFTANGADGSTANAMHLIQGTDEVYQRSYVRFEDLPDTNNTRLMVLRMGSSANPFIVSAGVFNMSSNVYWCIDLLGNSANPPENYTQATINADQWYLMELYYNATTNGNAILWINNVLQGQTTGDYSAYGLERVYPYIYVEDAQVSAKTVYHDNYRVDNVRIGGGTPKIIQVVEEEEDEGESGTTTFITPLPNVMINGSYLTDSSEEEVEVSWARERWMFTFKGLYDEDSGSYLSSVDVTAYYVNLTSTNFTVNGTHYFSSEYEPLYFLFTLTPYDREYWIHTGENDTTIYIFNASTSVYTFAFLDLADALDYPYVEAKYYVNGTLQTVEKRKVDMENKIQMSLVEGKKYSVVIWDNTTHTYSDLFMTSTTTVQLPIKGIELPEGTLPISEKVWIYGNRTFDSPNGSISIAYQDELNQTNSVKIYVNYKNGTNAYNGTETASSFIHTWSSALNNTDYTIVAIVDHAQYGITTWKQPLPYRILGTPSSTSFFGTIGQFVTSIIISSCIILAIVVRTGVLKRDMFMHAHLTSSMSRSLIHAQIKKTLVWAVAHHLFFSTQS